MKTDQAKEEVVAPRIQKASDRLSAREWKRAIGISVVAILLFVVARRLPTGTNLSHLDFQSSTNGLELCDPSNPQFIPAVAVRSPVNMALTTAAAPLVETTVRCTLDLVTANGKPIAPVDLLTVHTQKLHLLIIDPALVDYQHIHPEPTAKPGRWTFTFTPHRSGVYRLFADFMPAATARGLYAQTDLSVAEGGERIRQADTEEAATDFPAEFEPVTNAGVTIVIRPLRPLQLGRLTELILEVNRPDGKSVGLEPIMGAYAHLVAFDEERSGFAHLHPTELSLVPAPDPIHPTLRFRLTLQRPGRYVIWAQLKIGGKEIFAPFWFEVKS